MNETVTFTTASGKSATVTSEKLDQLASEKRLWFSLELPGNPDDVYRLIPSMNDFIEAESEFIPADEPFAGIYNALLSHFEDKFSFLWNAQVKFFWKEKGGASGGSDTLGKCQKPSGLLKHFAETDYIIWLAADHCRTRQFTNWQVLALIYHELRHTALDENGKFIVRGHEFEGFIDEIERFGAWKSNNAAIIAAAQKLPGF